MVWGRKSGLVPSPQKHYRRRDLMNEEYGRRQWQIRRLVYLNFGIKDLQGSPIRKAVHGHTVPIMKERSEIK